MKYTANASEKFTSDLRKAIHIARLAPSSHNSQPWLVNVIDSNHRHFTTVNIEPDNSYYIAIEFDSERVLSSLAKLNDEMYISCGIFTQYVCLCLSHSGYQSTITWVDKGNTIAIIKIQYHAEVLTSQLLPSKLIQKRLTNRGAYTSARISTKMHSSLKNYARQYDKNLILINDESHIRHVSNLTEQYAGLDFSNKKAWRETYRHIHFNKKGHHESGFYLAHLFGDVSWLFSVFFRLFFHPDNHKFYTFLRLHRHMAKGLSTLIAKTPQLIAITVKDETPENFWEVGLSLGYMMLKAEESGFSFHPISVLTQHNEPRSKLNAVLKTNQKVAFLARLGIPNIATSDSPRRSVDSVLPL